MNFAILSSDEIALELALRLKNRRLGEGLTLEGLSERSGVALGTLKRFERTGKIALVSFIQLAVALKDEAALEGLLLEPKFESLDDVLEPKKKRKRGRIK